MSFKRICSVPLQQPECMLESSSAQLVIEAFPVTMIALELDTFYLQLSHQVLAEV